MVIKTATCTFSEMRIYPGHGKIFIRRDARKVQFLTKREDALYHGSRKPLKLRWTRQWRRAHKKEDIIRQVKKGKKRAVKSDRGIVGLSLQTLLLKKNESQADRKKIRQHKIQSVKEIKNKTGRAVTTAGSKAKIVRGGKVGRTDTKLALRKRLKLLKQKNAGIDKAKEARESAAEATRKEKATAAVVAAKKKKGRGKGKGKKGKSGSAEDAKPAQGKKKKKGGGGGGAAAPVAERSQGKKPAGGKKKKNKNKKGGGK